MSLTLYNKAVYIFGLCVLVVFIFSSSILVCHCRSEFSQALLKNIDSKISHSCMSQWMKHVSDKCLPMQTHILYLNTFLISQTASVCTQIQVSLVYKIVV
jgi:hypothetical protein